MSLRLRSRPGSSDAAAPALETEVLADEGVHRDGSLDDPVAGNTLSQRVVRAASSLLGGGSSRRSFLTKTAIVGSALAVDPFNFVLKPGTAYGAVCGTCGDGWTAFCCTVNGGSNTCPSGSFVAGWWKADNAAYCCGAARYIIDCNARCPTSCTCRCSGAGCDGRRTCCNQFRYGQCHQEISCYGPVVCRIATCTPPWRYDPSCTTSSATDNRTVEHGAPCLPNECAPPPPPPPSAIGAKYAALGGAGGLLGPLVQGETDVADGSGRYATYRNGYIYWSAATGPHELHGAVLFEYVQGGGPQGPLKYPTTDVLRLGGRGDFAGFQSGQIFSWAPGTFAVDGVIYFKYQTVGGANAFLGWPVSSVKASGDRRSNYVNFEHGRIYARDTTLIEIHGAIYAKHEQLGGVYGFLGYPITDEVDAGDGHGRTSWFEHGFIFVSFASGCYEVHGAIADTFLQLAGVSGSLGYPTSDEHDAGGGGRVSTFQRGRIYASFASGSHSVTNPFLDFWLARGGPTGPIGFPTTEAFFSAGRWHQNFTKGKVAYDPATRQFTIV